VTWIQTHSGRQFWPLAPRPEDFDVMDIAHSLSLLCRFNGHCRQFYSVAEHSVRVSMACPPEHARWGLLHDLAEAYFGDIPTPVKDQFPDIEAMERKLQAAAALRYDLPWPIPEPVHHADAVLLATEARDLMGEPPSDWGIEVEPLPDVIEPLTPLEAKAAFVTRFEDLE